MLAATPAARQARGLCKVLLPCWLTGTNSSKKVGERVGREHVARVGPRADCLSLIQGPEGLRLLVEPKGNERLDERHRQSRNPQRISTFSTFSTFSVSARCFARAFFSRGFQGRVAAWFNFGGGLGRSG